MKLVKSSNLDPSIAYCEFQNVYKSSGSSYQLVAVISPTQIAFMRGRNILEGAVILHETVHELHRKNLSRVIIKIDFEKVYDMVRWDLLFQTLSLKGFSLKWIEWIRSFISSGSVAINVNDEVGPFFPNKGRPKTR